MTVVLRTPIKINGYSVIVTDPCYYEGTEYAQHEITNVKPGRWYIEVPREEFDFMGTRCAELTIVHTDWDRVHAHIQEGSAGVDSGQMSICGSTDAEKFKNRDYAFNDFDPDGHAGQFNYEGACHVTLNGDHCGVLCDVMAVSETGCGDGVYPIIVWRDGNGAATKITVDFRDHPWLDDGDEDEEIEEEEEEDDDE